MLFWFALWGSVPLLSHYIDEAVKAQKRPSLLLRLLGGKLILVGVLLNAIGGKTLKRYGHFHIKEGVSAPERVVSSGIYSCMRHPAQFGSGLIGMGIGMLTGTLSGAVAGMFSLLMSFLFMLNIEEPETMKRFPDYCEKMAGIPGVNLNVRCIMRGIKSIATKK